MKRLRRRLGRAQRVDAVTKKPLDAPFSVLDEHSARYHMDIPSGVARFDVAKGVILYWRAKVTGNIWLTRVMLERPALFGIR